MIAHFIAHLIAQEKNPIAALRHLHQDPTIALITPKIAISFTRTQVLLSKDRKHKCVTVGFLCALALQMHLMHGTLKADI
jgi:hypothetical protein